MRQFVRLYALAALLVACGEATVQPAALHPLPVLAPEVQGPFGVGVITRELPAVDKPGAQPFMVDVWYPADLTLARQSGAAGRTPYSGLYGMQVRDLPPLRGYQPFPVAVFSHGLGAIRDQNAFQVQQLVTRGYVVISADHHPSTILDVAASDKLEDAIVSALYRPLEVLAQIDALERWSADDQDILHGLVDASRVLMLGHSYGGYTALSVSGAHADIDVMVRACDADPDGLGDTFQCRLARRYEGDDRVFEYHDPRIAAVMPMTPGATPLFREGGLASIDVPVFVWAGANDETAEPELYQDWLYPELPKSRFYLKIPGAGHLDFSQICRVNLPIECNMDGPLSTIRTLELINEVTMAYADWTVRGIESARETLEPEALLARWPMLEYQAEFR